jgi:hypothetical protein
MHQRCFAAALAIVASVVWTGGLGATVSTGGLAAAAQRGANPRAAALADFSKRVSDYVNLAGKQAGGLTPLKKMPDPAEIAAAEKALGDRIRAARAAAKQGDIFTPQVAPTFRSILKQHYAAGTTHEKKELLEEVPLFHPAVNQVYPPDEAKATMTASLLGALPKLPSELEYRIVGTNLILRDVKANLIVDYIPDALPPSAKQHEDKS